MMQWSTAYGMPTALGVSGGWSLFLKHVRTVQCLHYWWVPDSTFIQMLPEQLLFARHSANEWLAGDKKTGGQGSYVSKMVSNNLQSKAGRVREFVSNINFELPEVQNLLLEFDATGSAYNVSCKWIRNNRARWSAWKPKLTSCYEGFGLVDASGAFVPNRTLAVGCGLCQAGTASEELIDDEGRTFQCKQCPPGYSQSNTYSTKCEPCPKGTSASMFGSISCTPCNEGEYQPDTAQTSCIPCDASRTTLLLGASSLADCVCQAGKIEQLSTCEDCSEESMHCPKGSTIAKLVAAQGTTDTRGPFVKKGFFSNPLVPLDTYKCTAELFCPGGSPGQCFGDREGLTCGDCADGHYWGSDQCEPCGAVPVAWAFSVTMVVLGVCGSYYMLTSSYTAKASVMMSTTATLGMLVALFQNLGVLNTVAVPWPAGLEAILSFASIFTFNLDALGFSCAAGSNVARYVSTASFFWIVVLALPLVGLLTNFIPILNRRKLAWEKNKTISTTGQFLQVGFTTMCNVGLMPFMCYRHPTGQASILKYPNVFCGTDEHVIMRVFGVFVLILAFTFFTAACYAAYQAPKWLAAIRFLIFRFRPNVWYFGLVLLARGPLLSMPGVIATNMPSLQLTLMHMILLGSLCLQLWFLPWKSPILNLVDGVSVSLLVMLLAGSLGYADSSGEDAARVLATFGTVISSLMVAILGGMVSLGLTALVYRSALGSSKELRIMNLGKVPEEKDVFQSLLDVATFLKEDGQGKEEKFIDDLGKLSVYDIGTITRAMNILADDLNMVVSQNGSVRKSSSRRIATGSRSSASQDGKADPEKELFMNCKHAVLAWRSKFLQRKDLTPRQVNATVLGGFLLAPVMILVQKAYYDTLIEFRGWLERTCASGWDYDGRMSSKPVRRNETLHDTWEWYQLVDDHGTTQYRSPEMKMQTCRTNALDVQLISTAKKERRVLGRPFQLNHNMDQSGAGPAQGSAKEQKGRGRGRAARGRGRGRSSGTPADAAARPGPPTEVEDQRSTEVEHSTTEVGADHPRVKTRGPVSPAAALPGSPVRARSQNLTAQLDCLMFDSQEIGITQVAEEKPGLRVATATTGLQVATAVLEKPIPMEEPETIPGFGEEEPQAHSSSPPHIAVVVPAVPALGGVEEGAPGTVSRLRQILSLTLGDAMFKPRDSSERTPTRRISQLLETTCLVKWFEVWFGACHKPICFSTGPEGLIAQQQNLSGEVLKARYEFIKELGTGGFGVVYLVREKTTGLQRVIKTVDTARLTERLLENMREEIQVLRDLDHPNIIRLFEYGEDVAEHKIHLLMERLSGGDLDELLERSGRLSEELVARLTRQVLSGIVFCHAHGVVHRDLKPGNIMLACPDLQQMSPRWLAGSLCVPELLEEGSYDCKIIDFGLAKTFDPSDPSSGITDVNGTPAYMAPEICLRAGKYGAKSDVWSIGVMAYELLTGCLPFGDASDYAGGFRELFEITKQYRDLDSFWQLMPQEHWRDAQKIWRHCSWGVREFVSSLVLRDPNERPSAAEALQSSWLSMYKPPRDGLTEEILASILDYTEATHFVKICLLLIAARLGAEELESFRHAFLGIDVEGNGSLSMDEFVEAVENLQERRLCCRTRRRSQMAQWFEEIDLNNDGRLDYSEFLAACLHSQLRSLDESGSGQALASQAFQVIDVDGDGLGDLSTWPIDGASMEFPQMSFSSSIPPEEGHLIGGLTCVEAVPFDGFMPFTPASLAKIPPPWTQMKTLSAFVGTTRRVKAGDEVHCMLALRKLLKERRHLDIKIACKVNTGSQQVKCSCRSASATALLFVMCRGCFRMI
ncbi:Calcium-dependent protein kinase 16 [Durusdinium trenchii]|uniref:Calcium-dependent protein kinase 16 n=1 Tax=Durusdinium trenchii TaxID=1381693 RepID=A0ABP0QGL3_9DINO